MRSRIALAFGVGVVLLAALCSPVAASQPAVGLGDGAAETAAVPAGIDRNGGVREYRPRESIPWTEPSWAVDVGPVGASEIESGIAPGSEAAGRAPAEVALLLASDGTHHDWFGYTVAVSGTIAVVGSSGHDFKGAVYVFEPDPVSGAWSQTAKLTAPDGREGDGFGSSVAVSGTTVVIGAEWDDKPAARDAGSVYVFDLDAETGAWKKTAKLALAGDGDHFGHAVAISGPTMVVGAPDRNEGMAYVLERDPATATWTRVASLAGSEHPNRFGASVALSGATVVVGAPEDGADSSGGAAYVFMRDPSTGLWEETARLIASDGAGDDHFGWSVAVSGARALIGSPLDDDDGRDSGSVYTFDRDPATGSWEETGKLTASDAGGNAEYGTSLAMSDSDALVGAPRADKASGSVYVLGTEAATGLWEETFELTAFDGAQGDEFGRSVALSAATALIGAPHDDDLGDSAGAASVFRLRGSTGVGKVEGTITDVDGRPLEGMCVLAYDRQIKTIEDLPWALFMGAVPNSGFALTDGAGRYSLTLPAPARYVFYHWDCDNGILDYEWYWDKGGVSTANVVLLRDGSTMVLKDVELREAGGIGGIVTDQATGLPLEGIEVWVTGPDGYWLRWYGITDSDGWYAVGGFREETDHYLQFRDPDWVYQHEWFNDQLTFEDASPVRAWADDFWTGAEAALRRGACTGRGAIKGDDGDNVLMGTEGDDVIVGFGGNDEIRGNGGNDLICAGDGDDIVIGGGGDDVLLGEAGNDLVKGLRNDDFVHGGTGDDRLQGNAGDDVLDGGDGKDKIWGGIGDDFLYGDAGRDQLHGNAGFDTLWGGAGTDRMWGDADDDLLFGEGSADFLYGGIGSDGLWGGEGNDRLFGGKGDDGLFGGTGRDQLRGQQGDDLVDGGPHHDWCSVETVWLNCEVPL